MEGVKCVGVWLGAGCEVWGVRGLGFGFTNPVETGGVWDECLCLGCGGVGGLGGVVMVCVGGVMYVCVVSLDYLCRWQVHLSVFCSRRIPAHLRCTQLLLLSTHSHGPC